MLPWRRHRNPFNDAKEWQKVIARTVAVVFMVVNESLDIEQLIDRRLYIIVFTRYLLFL